MMCIIAAILSLMIVGFLFGLTLVLFFCWLLFCVISFVLSLVGLQQYAWLVFILYILFGGGGRRYY
ncbi:MAG: hypothetical protein K6F57_03160 [Candidatus Saccharibacteria bacterium]|nr:hypothetical protein [Candidatus Saccharibacteria bacterium]